MLTASGSHADSVPDRQHAVHTLRHADKLPPGRGRADSRDHHPVEGQRERACICTPKVHPDSQGAHSGVLRGNSGRGLFLQHEAIAVGGVADGCVRNRRRRRRWDCRSPARSVLSDPRHVSRTTCSGSSSAARLVFTSVSSMSPGCSTVGSPAQRLSLGRSCMLTDAVRRCYRPSDRGGRPYRREYGQGVHGRVTHYHPVGIPSAVSK